MQLYKGVSRKEKHQCMEGIVKIKQPPEAGALTAVVGKDKGQGQNLQPLDIIAEEDIPQCQLYAGDCRQGGKHCNGCIDNAENKIIAAEKGFVLL